MNVGALRGGDLETVRQDILEGLLGKARLDEAPPAPERIIDTLQRRTLAAGGQTLVVRAGANVMSPA